MFKRNADWICAEVKLTRSLGYGTYAFTVRNVSHLEPSVVLTLSTWDGTGTEDNRRELDIEIGRWGFVRGDNAQYVVQPYYIPVNIIRFRAPAGRLTYSFRWEPGQATFSTAAVPARGRGSHELSVNISLLPESLPLAERRCASICIVLGRGTVPLKNQTEVVIDKFEYLP